MISFFYELVVWSGLFTKVSVYDRVVGDQVACLAGVERGGGGGGGGGRGERGGGGGGGGGAEGGEKGGGWGQRVRLPSLFPSLALFSLPLPFLRLPRRQEIKLLVERDRVKIP